ncbi:MAG: penicillin-binding transpeptidase domain-containing protein [Acidimicrobiales bacterium]
MSRRIRWLGVVMVVCFAVVLVQLVNVQFRKAQALRNSPENPRNAVKKFDNPRGDILAANGTVLAQSVLAPKGSGPYTYMRSYPTGQLFAQIVGIDDSFYGAYTGVEQEYNSYLTAHTQSPKTLSQLLSPPPPTTDVVTLTVEPYLQQVAQNALASITSPHRDGAIVVLNPHTGAVLAMYSSPSYDPAPLASPDVAVEEKAGNGVFHSTDAEGFSGGVPMATFDPIFPGSTFKIVTTTAVYNLAPQLASFNYPVSPCTKTLPDSNKVICNDASSPQHAVACGGTIAQMLPPSCDPGYATLGMKIGPTDMVKQSELFGYNAVPPIDLPTSGPGRQVVASYFPSVADFQPQNLGLAGLAYSAFGQQNVQTTALQNALVAAAVANGGTIMTPHVMASIHDSNGHLVKAYQPTPWKQPMSAATAQTVNTLMQAVVTTPGATAYGVANSAGVSLASLHAAVKTGTSQTGLPTLYNIDDWMIGFAPANNPQVAVAVVVPYQPSNTYGATVAGPIMATMLQAALNPPPGQ